MAKVSIIIPLYNRIKLIKETLESLSQTNQPNIDLEIIVVDDGSTDGGADWVEHHYPSIKLLRQKNSGAPKARNLGLSEAKGDCILFLDSDDLVEPNFFTEKIKILEANRDLAAVYGPWEHFKIEEDGSRKILPRHKNYPIEDYPDYNLHLNRLLSGWYIICHALLWRKEVLVLIEGFDNSLKINQDVDLLFRALSDKRLIRGVNAPLALYRDHQENSRIGSVNNAQKLESILIVRKSFISKLSIVNLLDSEKKKIIAEYCFDMWAANVEDMPKTAEKFYILSKKLYPKIKIKGGKIFLFLGKIFGAKNAVLLKLLINKKFN